MKSIIKYIKYVYKCESCDGLILCVAFHAYLVRDEAYIDSGEMIFVIFVSSFWSLVFFF